AGLAARGRDRATEPVRGHRARGSPGGGRPVAAPAGRARRAASAAGPAGRRRCDQLPERNRGSRPGGRAGHDHGARPAGRGAGDAGAGGGEGMQGFGASFWPLAMCRELDDLTLWLRTNEVELGTWVVRTSGAAAAVARHEHLIEATAGEDWLAGEIRLFLKRT